MFELIRSSSSRELLTRHAPGLLIAFVIAEVFYKWGSFSLECLGFLATWLVVDALFALASGKTARNRATILNSNRLVPNPVEQLGAFELASIPVNCLVGGRRLHNLQKQEVVEAPPLVGEQVVPKAFKNSLEEAKVLVFEGVLAVFSLPFCVLCPPTDIVAIG